LHLAVLVHEFLAKKFILNFILNLFLLQQSYLPNLSLCDFFLIPEDENEIQRQSFWKDKKTLKRLTDVMNSITKLDFRSCYKQWKTGANALFLRGIILKDWKDIVFQEKYYYILILLFLINILLCMYLIYLIYVFFKLSLIIYFINT